MKMSLLGNYYYYYIIIFCECYLYIYKRSLDFTSFTAMDLIYGEAVFLQLELGVLKSSHTVKRFIL